MQTKNLIQSSASVIRITNLTQGDIYKRIEDTSYSSDVKYGVVVGIYNDGEKTFIESIEYKTSYGEISAERKVISGTADVCIFPATVEEVTEEFANAIASIEKKIADKKEEVAKMELALIRGKEFVSGEQSKKLTTASFKEMTQGEYVQEKHMKELASAS